MALNDFSIDLFCDETVSPKVYWIQTSANFSAPHIIYKEDGVGDVPTTTGADGNFHLDVLLRLASGSESADNPVCHLVDLDTFPFTSENDTLEVHLLDANGVPLTSGTIKTQDAQHETRPWGATFSG